jgi:hypothetical protein
MFWIIGTIVVVSALVLIAKRRNKRDPSYNDPTQGRIDDHGIKRWGDNMQDRFGGGTLP